MELRPVTGGFLRPFGTAWFIVEFLKGNGPEGSKRIDPDVGAPMVDIHFEYKLALHRAHARDAVEKAEERQIKRGKPAFAEQEFNELFEYYLSRIPYKLTKMRYASFTRYFGHMKRLKWVEETGQTEPSTVQDDYPPAPSRVFYRLTEAGWKAPPFEVSNPLRALYPHFDSAYSREKKKLKLYARY